MKLACGGPTDSFWCTVGYKQGCPARPLLLGPYIDALKVLEALLREAKGNTDAPSLLHVLVAVPMVADDMALLSYSPERLQQQLDILQQHCPDYGLTVNVENTKMLIFCSKQASAPAFTCRGDAIKRVDSCT